MSKAIINIDFIIASSDEGEEKRLRVWCENVFKLLEYFFVYYQDETVQFKLINLTGLSDFSSLVSEQALNIVVVNREMQNHEKFLMGLDFKFSPVIVQQNNLDAYRETFLGTLSYNLSEYENRLILEHFVADLQVKSANEGLLNYAFHISKFWLNLDQKNVKEHGVKVLLCTVHQTLLDYQSQLKLYLERAGYLVNVFYFEGGYIAERKKALKEKIIDYNVSVHMVNRFFKRFDKDNDSILKVEMDIVLDHINDLEHRFDAFFWVDTDMSNFNHDIEQLIEKVKIESSQTPNIHAYQLPIEEFKNLMVQDLDDIFVSKETKANKFEKQNILVYEDPDLEEGKAIIDGFKAKGVSFLDYGVVKRRYPYFMNDYETVCGLKNIVLFADETNHKWVKSMVQVLLKTIGFNKSKLKTKVFVVVKGAFDGVDFVNNYGFYAFEAKQLSDVYNIELKK